MRRKRRGFLNYWQMNGFGGGRSCYRGGNRRVRGCPGYQRSGWKVVLSDILVIAKPKGVFLFRSFALLLGVLFFPVCG